MTNAKDEYRALEDRVEDHDECLFHKAAHNRDRNIEGLEAGYVEAGCKYLCAGKPYNGLPMICPEYTTLHTVAQELNVTERYKKK